MTFSIDISESDSESLSPLAYISLGIEHFLDFISVLVGGVTVNYSIEPLGLFKSFTDYSLELFWVGGLLVSLLMCWGLPLLSEWQLSDKCSLIYTG